LRRLVRPHEGGPIPALRAEAQPALPGDRLETGAPARPKTLAEVVQATLGGDDLDQLLACERPAVERSDDRVAEPVRGRRVHLEVALPGGPLPRSARGQQREEDTR